MEWISIKERLPETPDWYICFRGGTIFKNGDVNKCFVDRFLMTGSPAEGFFYASDVTHWCPITTPKDTPL